MSFKPGNQFGRGRPRGSRNKKTLLPQEFLDSHADAVVRQALVLALKGDSQLLRVLLGHILPRPRDLPLKLKLGPLPMGSATELSQSSEKLMKKVTSGQISLSDATELAGLMDRRRQIIETESHEMRIRAIEEKVDADRAA
jgi:hypothetical protein